jgi:p-aminobenzoyl-glutamate transporter AbgT
MSSHERDNFLARVEHGDSVMHHIVPLVVLDVSAIPVVVELQENVVFSIVHPDTTDEVPVGVLPGDTNLSNVVGNLVRCFLFTVSAKGVVITAEVKVEP